MYGCTYVYVYVCMDEFLNVCMGVRMYNVCINVCMCVLIHVWMCMCMFGCIYGCMYVVFSVL